MSKSHTFHTQWATAGPRLDADRLLSWLRLRLRRADLAFATRPTLLGVGGEAVVDAFTLQGAPPELRGPLVVRRLTLRNDRFQALWEASIHTLLSSSGYPVPRVYLVEPAAEPLGAPFLIMDRLAGSILLAEALRPGELLARPAQLPRLLREAIWRVPSLLADAQAQLHAIDAEALSRSLQDAGFSPRQVSFDGQLDRLEGTIETGRLAGLRPGLDWLRENRLRSDETVLCHGDLVFTNVMVDGGHITGVFDWSRAAVAHPAYDVAGTLARLDSPIPGVQRGLRALFGSAQRLLARRYLHAYRRRRPVDGDALRYFGAFWVLSELVWSGAKRRGGQTPTARVEDRWLHGETIDVGVRRFRQLTGVSVTAALGDGSNPGSSS